MLGWDDVRVAAWVNPDSVAPSEQKTRLDPALNSLGGLVEVTSHLGYGHL